MKPSLLRSTPLRRAKPSSQLVEDAQHFMVELDPDLLKSHPARRNKGSWLGRFIIATWVRFPEGLNQKVSLVLVYKDAEARKSRQIDMCRANRQTLILLNGKVDLEFVGEVSEMALVLEGLREDAVWILDEYRMESTGGAAAIVSKRHKRATA